MLVKGPNRMLGYLEQPDASARWYNTGDIGALDEDGFLRIADRPGTGPTPITIETGHRWRQSR